MNIYTKTGDKGQTSLYDNKRVYKDDIRVESYGTIDELISFIGLSKNYIDNKEIYKILEEIQNKLFVVTSNLATYDPDKVKHTLKAEDVENLEHIIDEYMKEIDQFTEFLIPGSGKNSAYMDVSRSVCRRAERRMIQLSRNEDIDPLLIKYVNRLSDVLYIFGRYFEDKKTAVKY